jgi:general secretion pathway protein D
MPLKRFLSAPQANKSRLLALAVAACVLNGEVVAADGETVSLAEREIQRRASLLNDQAAKISEAEIMLAKGQADEAMKAYEAAYLAVPDLPMARPLREAALDGFFHAGLRRAGELINGADYAGAGKILDRLEPLVSLEEKQKIRQLRAKMEDPDRHPPALTPKHISNVEQVQKLLVRAASEHETGQYDKALQTYEDVLRIDPTNSAARRGMETVERERARYLQSAADHQRSRLLSEVSSLWENKPVSRQVQAMAADASLANAPLMSVRDRKETLARKLREIKIQRIDFAGASLEEVIEYLRVRSRDVDPEGKGIDFVMSLGGSAPSRQISLNLVDVPVEEVLRYAAEIAGVTFRVEEFAVRIVPLTDTNETLISKTYRVPPDFISAAPMDAAAAPAPADPFAAQGAAAAPSGLLRRLSAREFLESRGIVFPEGGGASFNPAANMLIVRTTAKNLELVDALVDQSLNSSPKMAVIDVKVVEINNTKLDELGFDWLLGGFIASKVELGGGTAGNQQPVAFAVNEFPANPLLNKASMGPLTAGLRSSADLNENRTIDDVLFGSTTSESTRSPGVISLAGVLTDPQFQVVIRAMDQRGGVDLVSKPSIITKSGQPASVEIVREMIYPTEFDPPQIPTNVGANVIFVGVGPPPPLTIPPIPVTPTTPTAFETRRVGMVLNVEPVISDDARSVDLTLTPEFTEFVGFVNYGSPIFNVTRSSIAAGVDLVGKQELTPNTILQPIFSTKKVTTAVKVYDGATIVLGGVISDNTIMIDDKIPVLGDVPVVGRLFQGKVKQKRSKNMLMFVSVKVVDPSGNRVNRP